MPPVEKLPATSANGAGPTSYVEAELAAAQATNRTLENVALALANTRGYGSGGAIPAAAHTISLTSFEDIKSRRIEWLWEGRIPDAALTILMGNEGHGKTAAGLAIMAALTRGELKGARHGKPMRCAIIAPEDDAGAVLKPRLIAAGADLSLVRRVNSKAGSTDNEVGLSLPDDTDEFVRQLVESDVEFVFVDPLASLLNPGANTWKDTDIRQALEPLMSALGARRITVLGALHTNKSKSTDPRERGMGSVGWRQVCRSQLMLGLDPDAPEDDQTARCLAHTKTNYGLLAPTIRVRHESVSVPLDDGSEDSILRSSFGEECYVTAEAMLAASSPTTRARRERSEDDGLSAERRSAGAWLLALLSAAKGSMLATEVEEARQASGECAYRTLERAKADVGVRSERVDGHWHWRLPRPNDAEPSY